MSEDAPPNGEAGELPSGPAPEGVPQKPTSVVVRVFLRGLAICLPPILTLVILLWLGRSIYNYVVSPVSSAVQYTIAQFIEESRPVRGLERWDHQPDLQYVGRNDYRMTKDLKRRVAAAADAAPDEQAAEIAARTVIDANEDEVFVPYGNKVAVPYDDYSIVIQETPVDRRPTSAIGMYMEFVVIKYFKSVLHLSILAVVVTAVLLWFIGGLMTAGLGRWFVTKFEQSVVGRVPVVSNVYSSVKQVTDFFFTERTVSYNRVVAVEYPRRGVYSIGFVTGDSMLQMTSITGEPMLAVLMPTSPMPMTGFTITVPRSQVVDLDISIDQAFQFCLSCGVLVPPQQQVTPERLQQELQRRLSGAMPSQTVLESGPAWTPPAVPGPSANPAPLTPPGSESTGDDTPDTPPA